MMRGNPFVSVWFALNSGAMRQQNYRPVYFCCLLALALAACMAIPARAETLLCTDFETNPMTLGWTTNNSGMAIWTTNLTGGYSITCSNGGTWLSPLINTTPLQWYRLTFRSRAPGIVNNPGSIGYAYWAATYFDTNGNPIIPDQYASIYQSSDWVTNECRIRAKNTAGSNATLVPVQMEIRFQSINPQVFIDSVRLETTTSQEVAQWGDAEYDAIPAKLAYVPKSDRWMHLPLTMNRLRTGFFCDIQNHIATQIRIGRARAADRPRFIGQTHMLRILVRLRIHGDGVDAQAPAGADHAAGDLATIGNQYALEHAESLRVLRAANLVKLADLRVLADARRSMAARTGYYSPSQ